MIYHIVMWKIKGEVEEKNKNSKFVIDKLKSLRDNIPLLKDLHAGTNFSSSKNAFDIVLITSFESEEDLNNYRNHPYHKKIVEEISPFLSQSAVVDFKE